MKKEKNSVLETQSQCGILKSRFLKILVFQRKEGRRGGGGGGHGWRKVWRAEDEGEKGRVLHLSASSNNPPDLSRLQTIST